MTKTNVDDTDIINFRYKDGTLASLTCSITADTDNTAIIYGEKGKIVIPNFWMAKEATLYSNSKEEKFEDSYNEAGYKHEITEANECILCNRLESNIASHDFTLNLEVIMDEIRRQIGLIYPFESEKYKKCVKLKRFSSGARKRKSRGTYAFFFLF